MKTHNETVSDTPAKKDPSADLDDELRPEYDASMLKNGVRGKYLAEYQSSTNQSQQKYEQDKVST